MLIGKASKFLWPPINEVSIIKNMGPRDTISLKKMIDHQAKSWTADHSLRTHHVGSMLKRRGNSHFHVVSTWNPGGVFVGLPCRLWILVLINFDLFKSQTKPWTTCQLPCWLCNAEISNIGSLNTHSSFCTQFAYILGIKLTSYHK